MALITRETDDEFYKLFKGIEGLYNSGAAYEQVLVWLDTKDSKERLRCLVACLMFYEKPKKYLLRGESKQKKEGKMMVDRGVAKYLPKHSTDPMVEGTPEAAAMAKARANFPPEFKMVNFTMVRNVALLHLQVSVMIPVQISIEYTQWVKHFGGGPLHLLEEIDVHYPSLIVDGKPQRDETKEIRFAHLTKFKNDREFWKDIVTKLADRLRGLSSGV